MKIGKVNSNIAFGRDLTQDENLEFKKITAKATNILNNDKPSNSIFIVHEPCLPQDISTDTGIGHLTSKTSGEFFDFAKDRFGINAVEVLPPGEIKVKSPGFYNAYNGSGLSLGTQQIDLELLTKPEFSSILSNEDFQTVVTSNKNTQKEGFVNYENIIGRNSEQENALIKAFKNYTENKSVDKTAFEQYKKQNADWLERKAVFSALSKKNEGKHWSEWEEIERTLFDVNDKTRLDKIAEIQTKYKQETEFYKFKQFLADEHLKLGRESLNKKGLKLFGDCLIGFSDDEVWAYKDAFMFDKNKKLVFVGNADWKLPALDYSKIKDETSSAQKLLKKKVELFAKRYDGIRFDASWLYVQPKLSNGAKFNLEGSVLDIIDATVKKVKGNNYKPQDIIHEFEASPKDFSIFNSIGRVKHYLKDRVKVISSSYLSEMYGSTEAMTKSGATPESYVIGTGNHDPQPLKQLANDIPDIGINGKQTYRFNRQKRVLQDIFKLGAEDIKTPADFAKYKFAETYRALNKFLFYIDAFGSDKRFDSQMNNGWENYRPRIPFDFKAKQNKAVQEGFGFNLPDALAKAFKSLGLDKKYPNEYQELVKFSNIICENVDNTAKKAAEKTKNIVRTRILKTAGIVAVLGLIGSIITFADKGLKNQAKKSDFVIKSNI